MEGNAIVAEVGRIAVEAASELGVEFVHAETAGTKRNLTVRIYIDKPGGVTVDDCSTFSRRVEAVLDETDLIPTSYMLEVSSPGLERQLYSLGDFQKFAGQRAKVKLADPIQGQNYLIGDIEGVEGQNVVFNDKSLGRVAIPYGQVAKANLRVDLAEEFGKR
jgi:ribosome maturation factor RimP